MLYRTLFRLPLALPFTARTFSTTTSSFAMAVASPAQTFKLDRSIFNEALYSHMRSFWLGDVPPGASTPNFPTLQKWYGVDQSDSDKAAFDAECRSNFGHAIQALAPEKLALPAFESFEKDVENAEDISAPLLAEVKDAQAESEKKGAETLLALTLLFDQMTRNIYRDPAGLRLVFSHYDRLAFTLAHSSLRLTPNPIIDYAPHRHRPVIQGWYLMPLMHSEHLRSHQLFTEIEGRWKEEVAAAGDQPAVEYLERSLRFMAQHTEPLERFGRYPHRNGALGRMTSREEKEYMEGAETFGVPQKKDEGEDEDGREKGFEKSEL